MKGMKLTQVRRFSVVGMLFACALGSNPQSATSAGQGTAKGKKLLHIQEDEKNSKFEVFRESGTEPILTQVALPDQRPYLHPILAPDGNGVITEYRPAHHPHQTGIFWG